MLALDYATLKLIWWGIIGVLLIGFALTDGFDMGVAILLLWIGKNDDERRVVINTIGPVWEGNQTWLITAGGAIFAAWPLVYGAAFSGLYIALMLMLFALFFRPVGFDYRSKLTSPQWRSTWDICLFLGGFVPALICGVAFGNLLQGLPFNYDSDFRVFYHGSFFELLNPLGLLTGVLTLTMFVFHGAAYLAQRTEGPIQKRAFMAARLAAAASLLLFAGAGFWMQSIQGYSIQHIRDINGVITPLQKTVIQSTGAWLDNYERWPLTRLIPITGLIAITLVFYSAGARRVKLLWRSSMVAISSIILTAAVSMFPFIMPSSFNPNHSLTAWDATSSFLTLKAMLIIVLLLLPLVLLYTRWVYKVLWGKITVDMIHEKGKHLY